MFNSIPTITRHLLIINVLVFLAQQAFEMGNIPLTAYGGLWYFDTPYFHIYQLLTYMFLHGGFSHLFFNMFALWMFGCTIERVWGPKRFLFYYIVCGIGAGICQELVQGIMGTGSVTICASGAIYAILLAFGMTFPEDRIFIFPLPVPIKAKWFVVGYAAIELLMAVSQRGDGVAHMAHLGGMLFGFLIISYWRRNPNTQFDTGRGRQLFEDMMGRFSRGGSKGRQTGGSRSSGSNGTDTRRTGSNNSGTGSNNSGKREPLPNQEEIDRILDKIRQSGYASLTQEEKMKLFDASQYRKKQ